MSFSCNSCRICSTTHRRRSRAAAEERLVGGLLRAQGGVAAIKDGKQVSAGLSRQFLSVVGQRSLGIEHP
jgi:hypothetical protein